MDWHQYCIEPVSIFDEYVKFHYRSGGEHFQLIFMTGDTKPEPELRKFYLLEENSIFLIVCVEYMCVCSVVSYSLWPRGPILQKYFEFCQQISYKNLFSCYRNTCISSSWPLVLQSLKYLIPGLLQKKKLLISVVASQCLFKKVSFFLFGFPFLLSLSPLPPLPLSYPSLYYTLVAITHLWAVPAHHVLIQLSFCMSSFMPVCPVNCVN